MMRIYFSTNSFKFIFKSLSQFFIMLAKYLKASETASGESSYYAVVEPDTCVVAE